MMVGITVRQLSKLRQLIEAGQEHRFYCWGAWRRVRKDVLKLDHWECQYCRDRGDFSRGKIVHHVQHLKDRPDLALSIWDPDSGERQLITVCKACHEAEHPEALQSAPPRDPLTPERWD